MKVENLNSSSRKTKQLIKENFAVLMNEKKELHAITVTELVKRAGGYDIEDAVYQEDLADMTDLLREVIEQTK